MKRMGWVLLIGLWLAAAGAQAQVVLRGDVDYWATDRIRIEVENITNFGDETTDRLRLVLWASEDRWSYFDRGQVIALTALPRLSPHRNFHRVRRTTHFYRVRPGFYYVTLTLAERTVDENGAVRWAIRDVVEFGASYLQRGGAPWYPF